MNVHINPTNHTGPTAVPINTDKITIIDNMDIMASDGRMIGVVDHLDGLDRIKLVKQIDNKQHYIPLSLVASVDVHVRLSKSRSEIKQLW